MSMPVFPTPDPQLTREQALTMILSSIAIEELALSHIINAEGEKLQHVLKLSKQGQATVQEVLAVNKSVSDTLEKVSENQLLLKNKMEKVLRALPAPPLPPDPPNPQPPQPQPQGGCCVGVCCPQKGAAVFAGGASCGLWKAGASLPLRQVSGDGGIVLWPLGSSKILLPQCRRYYVDFTVNLRDGQCRSTPMIVELQLSGTGRSYCTFPFQFPTGMVPLTASGSAAMDTSAEWAQSRLSLVLRSPEKVWVDRVQISVTER